jgi:hypothetical protein
MKHMKCETGFLKTWIAKYVTSLPPVCKNLRNLLECSCIPKVLKVVMKVGDACA